MFAPQLRHPDHQWTHASFTTHDLTELVQASPPGEPRTTLGGSPQIILVIPGLRCKRTSPFGACEAFLCVSLLTLHTPMQQEEWVQGEDEERSSSDGRGSSYFSGERLDQIHSSSASPMRSQQSLTGGIDRSSLVRTL